jgi:hypothetical protein
MITHDHGDDESPSATRDRIARELAVLGEAPPEASELDSSARFDGAEGFDDEDVAITHALFRVAAGHADPTEALSPLEKRRVWKRLAGRIEPVQPSPGASGGHDMGRRMMAALAMAAAVVLVTRLAMVGQGTASSSTVESRAATEALATQARASLERIGGEADGARARSLADAYATRLRDGRGT